MKLLQLVLGIIVLGGHASYSKVARVSNQLNVSRASTPVVVLTDAEKEEFLSETNKLRCLTGVAKLVWDDDVARDAQEYVYPLLTMIDSVLFIFAKVECTGARPRKYIFEVH